jgi:hypothetical protein
LCDTVHVSLEMGGEGRDIVGIVWALCGHDMELLPAVSTALRTGTAALPLLGTHGLPCPKSIVLTLLQRIFFIGSELQFYCSGRRCLRTHAVV